MPTTRMTRKGQVTIPAEIRDRLNLNEGDAFLVREEDGKVILESQVEELRRTSKRIAELAKHVPPLEPPEIRQLAEAAIAQEGFGTLRQIERDSLAKQTADAEQ